MTRTPTIALMSSGASLVCSLDSDSATLSNSSRTVTVSGDFVLAGLLASDVCAKPCGFFFAIATKAARRCCRSSGPRDSEEYRSRPPATLPRTVAQPRLLTVLVPAKFEHGPALAVAAAQADTCPSTV
eukprot:CAMPEP_0167814114 /NCGR_PEP_ID=MMETSP0112_2-20121227/2235_1 /TAXON_ID=91324 /ORGANISM="Lotharella globosa, Strain CCCM811" /LENGTH=127 /DNA_ID=CAMNT_0007713283 /DNA_START=194 /DNA_END=577 /DNA_ORIENTATION=+